MSALSDRQTAELNKSVIQYLAPLITQSTEITEDQKQLIINQLFKSLSVNREGYEDGIPKHYLEKKWSAVLRLQKQIMELENDVQQYKDSLLASSSAPNSILLSKDKLNWLPSHINKNLKFYNSPITAIAIHPFQPVVCTASGDGVIIVWDMLNLTEPIKIIKNAHTKAITSLNFSPREVVLNNEDKYGSIYLASSSSDLMIKIWDANADYKALRTLTGHDHIVSYVAFHPINQKQLISCSRDTSIKIWDISSGWCLNTFIGHSDWVRKLDLTTTGEYVLSCSNDLSIRLSHLESGTGIGLMIGHSQVIETCMFFPKISNKYLDVLAKKFLFDDSEEESKHFLKNELYDQLEYKYCCSGGRDDLIKLWLLPLPNLRPHRHPMQSLDPNGKLILTLRGHSSWVKDLKIHPNGKILFSCSDDKTIKLWDLTNQNGVRCINTLTGHEGFVNCMEFSCPIIDTVDVKQNGNAEKKTNELEPEEEYMRKLASGFRNYFVSGGVDKSIIWG
ncbi:hypothetical protein PACTADRAFT_83557 [Pachysolen tannophilus NRRL Y-2460]|uniref:Nuclear distribution protein PAC1 n=1 Tax=Pachysolen tannophilus NRRL Y-2460 TaxID=669874 RepID=A0A1E4U2M4_PACTA|nr:hypothetical protein PACTADRAFT_83557 [Pachysolen tannophilus NRRL Y-2460]